MASGRARHLRKSMTEAERLFWKKVRNREFGDHKFRRQHPIGKYVVDFVCLEKKVIVELDGSGHLLTVEEDDVRTRWLNSEGYKVVRFWNNELKNWDEIEDAVWTALHPEEVGPRRLKHAADSKPSPLGGEGGREAAG